MSGSGEPKYIRHGADGDLSDHDSGIQFSIRVASCPIEEL